LIFTFPDHENHQVGFLLMMHKPTKLSHWKSEKSVAAGQGW